MPRTGENIYKRKDGRWEGRYIRERINGKAKYGAVYAKTYRDVKKKLEEAKKSLEEKERAPAGVGKVADICFQWLSEAAVTLKGSSVNKYEDILRCYILPEFGETELSDITNQQIIDFANRLLVSGGAKERGLAPGTVAEILSVMNGIRIYAMKRNHMVAFSPDCLSLKREQRDIRVFSLAEKKMYVKKTMQRLRIRTPEEKRTEVRILEPKSACSIRTIPLPDVIMGLLERFYAPGAFLLTGESKRFMEPRTIQNHFKRILCDCGIQNANFHTTRHTFATRCIELGFDVKSLSEILGHAGVAITMNRYVHPTMTFKAENMNRFSSLFFWHEGRNRHCNVHGNSLYYP